MFFYSASYLSRFCVTVHTHGVHSNESGLFKVALRQEAGFWSHYCIGL